ncbi:MAG: HIT family protein [Nanobdellota archaeon]
MAEEQNQMSTEEILKQQKEQCVFCKIIAGEISTTKVYEDEQVLAIMDINPATEGHVLLMPKEHYPIMPLIPKETFEHMFKISKYIAKATKKGFKSSKTSIFIANGGVAGQQSTHFMMHILPRDEGELDFLDAIGNSNEDTKNIENLVSNNIKAFVEKQSKESSVIKKFTQEKPKKETPEATEEQKKKISELYDNNEDFRNLILNDIDKLKELINTNPKWGALFRGVDVDALSQKLKEVEQAKNG